jgi:hypothetical protein
MTPSLKEHFPGIESLLEKIHAQMRSHSAKNQQYLLRQHSGPSINLEVVSSGIVSSGKGPSILHVVLDDPLPQYQQLCQAIKKMAPSQGVAVQLTFPPPAKTASVLPVLQGAAQASEATSASVTFPADLVKGVTPHPETLLAAIEKQTWSWPLPPPSRSGSCIQMFSDRSALSS